MIWGHRQGNGTTHTVTVLHSFIPDFTLHGRYLGTFKVFFVVYTSRNREISVGGGKGKG